MRYGWHLRVGLLCLLLGVYALVYVGQNHSKDEDWMLSAASTFVRHGELHIESVAANEWGSSVFATEILRAFAPDGAAYTKKGILPTVAMMPFIALADLLPRFWSTVAMVHLLNPLVIALCALLIAELGVRVGFGAGVSIVAALLYGLLSVALPYTQTIFGEPLVGLLLMLALWLTLNYHAKPTLFNALVVGCAIGLTIGVNPVYALFVPVVGLWLVGINPRRWNWLHGLVFGVPALLMVGSVGAYNLVRFGDMFYSGYNLSTNEGFIHPMHLGTLALLFSGYRGLMWYSPLAWLSLFGWGGLSRAHKGLAITTLALIVVNTLAFASWWSWHGGTVWGPRFMVPIMPLLALFWLAPLTVAARQAWARWSVVALAAVSGFVQLVAVLYAYNSWHNMLAGTYRAEHDNLASYLSDEVLYQPNLSAIWGHTSYLLAGRTDFLPAILRADFGLNVLLHGAAVLVLVGLGVALLRGWRAPLWAALGVMLAAVLAVPTLNPSNMHARAQQLAASATPSGVVFAITDELWLERVGRNQVVSAHAPTVAGHPYAQPRWNRALTVRPNDPYWFLTWFPPASAENWQERDLWERFAYVGEGWMDGNRLLRFDRRSIPLDTPQGASVGGLFTLLESGTVRYTDGVSVALAWQADDAIPADYSMFVHALDANGNIVHQVDRAPLGGYANTSTWNPTAPVITRFFAPSADVRAVRIGWLDPNTGAPLTVTAADGSTQDFVLLSVP